MVILMIMVGANGVRVTGIAMVPRLIGSARRESRRKPAPILITIRLRAETLSLGVLNAMISGSTDM